MEDCHHTSLERAWCIAEAKGHAADSSEERMSLLKSHSASSIPDYNKIRKFSLDFFKNEITTLEWREIFRISTLKVRICPTGLNSSLHREQSKKDLPVLKNGLLKSNGTLGKPGGLIVFAHWWATETEFPRLKFDAAACETILGCYLDNCAMGIGTTYDMSGRHPQVITTLLHHFTGAGAGTGDICLSRSRALTMSFNSATSGDTPEVEVLVLTLAIMALLRSDRTLTAFLRCLSINNGPFLVKLRESMMWTCSEKIFESIPSLTKRLIKPLFEIGQQLLLVIPSVGAWSNSAIVTINQAIVTMEVQQESEELVVGCRIFKDGDKGFPVVVLNLSNTYVSDSSNSALYAVPSLLHKFYSPPKKDLSWTCLPEFMDDTVTDYTRPTPSVDVSKDVRSDLDGNNTFIFEYEKHLLKINLEPKVPTGRTKIPTVGSNVPTAKPTGAANLGNKRKDVKASARWIWKPKENTSG
ncbi:hypothetical protein Tco_1070756 [Tanacetum coccineum]|uniref:Uncharacterized protein n=1 Tax=Tanacetum coccineum TaxID=301880 RepID=A0ABQ5HNP5_9ASTR